MSILSKGRSLFHTQELQREIKETGGLIALSQGRGGTFTRRISWEREHSGKSSYLCVFILGGFQHPNA